VSELIGGCKSGSFPELNHAPSAPRSAFLSRERGRIELSQTLRVTQWARRYRTRVRSYVDTGNTV
jgi:hypothetical protein